MSSRDRYLARFADATGAQFVAGREVSLSYADLLRILDRLADEAPVNGRRLTCTPAADLSGDCEQDAPVTFVVGFPCGTAAAAGFDPGRATHEELTGALAAARSLDEGFWRSLDASFVTEPTSVKGVPYGLLAGVSVGFGVRQNAGKTVETLRADAGDEDDEDEDPSDWEWKLPAPPAGLARVFGKNMDQETHPDHILGLGLGYGGDWTTVSLDVGDGVHAERVARLAAHGLDGEAAYWVLAVYD